MKLKRLLAAVAVLALFAPAAHADQAGLDRAVRDAVKTYRGGGASALMEVSQVCYPANNKFVDNGEKVDYCVGFDMASLFILTHTKTPKPQYFDPLISLSRMTGAAEHAGLFVGPSGLDQYVGSRMNFVESRVPSKL
ncbi:hypothetical protein PQQ99_09710 [Paraburkholderia sediminicola]|uniref:hypothetical protein n=1 Tax=Paraburkholderia sediminicola TaxID=458836 RepID=UPI0038BB9E56